MSFPIYRKPKKNGRNGLEELKGLTTRQILNKMMGKPYEPIYPEPLRFGSAKFGIKKRLEKENNDDKNPEDRYFAKSQKYRLWGDALNNVGADFGATAVLAAAKGAGGNAPLLGALSGALGALGKIWAAQSQKKLYKYETAQNARLQEEARLREQERERQRQQNKIAEMLEQRAYNEDLFNKRYYQTKTDEDRRYLRNRHDQENTYQQRYGQTQADEEKRYLRNRHDQENTYQQHKLEDRRDKILPKLSQEDQKIVYQIPGAERLAKITYPVWRAATLNRAFNGMSIPKSKEFKEYRESILADAAQRGRKLSEKNFKNFMNWGVTDE
ncbi:MAG: hypothetical protein LBS38_00310 [Endomicrobium sp.]|jgi:hypothetical protein|nr:hypothetical protein [Endomicrobium sp.]